MDEPAQTRSSVLLITRNLPPLRGGMERLVQRIAQSLADDCDLSVIGPDGCAAYLPRQSQTDEVAYRPLPRFLLAATRAVWKATRGRFTLVVAGSGLTAPLAWWAARRVRACFVVYLHGLDIVAPSVIYQRCWLPFIRRADLVLVNSRNTCRLAVERGIPVDLIEILHPGTELPRPDPDAGRAFRMANGLGDRPLLLSVGRLTPRKGLAEFISLALPAIIANIPDALLLVIGADANDAVRPIVGSEQERIMRSAEEAGVSESVRMLPPCDDAVLSAAYYAADAHIFPVLDLPGDVEGFGMVAIEAAAHGLPTIGFGVGGVPDAIVEGSTGSLVAPGNYAAFAAQVGCWLARSNQPEVREQCMVAVGAFGWDRFAERLRTLLLVMAARAT
jgi:phosphatidylinositol alpha-1,6-mannosyltransferase